MIEFSIVATSFPGNHDVSGLSETAGGALGFGSITSAIHSAAKSPAGFPYFWPVDLGRREVRPIRAKALRITLPGGQVIFRKYAGPAAPRFITRQALTSLGSSIESAAQSARGSDLHSWLKSFLNGIADLESVAFRLATPNVTGRLAQGYQVEHA